LLLADATGVEVAGAVASPDCCGDLGGWVWSSESEFE
jgi:hypothetical protein